MKIWAAAVMNNGSDHFIVVDTCKDGIYEQIVEIARQQYGPEDDYYRKNYADEYCSYEDYLFDQYLIQAEGEFDL